jgi:hypothetical protein
MSEEKKMARNIEKENLLKKLAEIDREEEVQNGQEQEQEQEKEQKFLFDGEFYMNTKVKQQNVQRSFWRRSQIMSFYTYIRTFINQMENIIHLFC